MNPTQNSLQPEPLKPFRKASTLSSFAKALLATTAVISVAGISGAYLSGSPFWATPPSADNVSTAQQEMRLHAYEALGALTLQSVTPADYPRAAESLALPDTAKHTLLADIEKQTSPSPTHAGTARLVWVTLWDTDAEDGDVIRIDSHGYSRTVELKKQPVTFAVPTDGNIRITGVRDGEGGGITVGLASGALKALLPIMSTDQTLNLSVRMD
jgi:hypothetical protein